MGRVRVTRTVAASVHEAETCWYDVSAWPQWVDELRRIVAVEGDWPRAGAVVRWETGPAGRGHVREEVVEHTPLAGQTVAVQDDSVTGRQEVAFAPAGDGTEVALALEYTIRRRSLLTPIVDRLFVRSAIARSLAATLERFESQLESRRAT